MSISLKIFSKILLPFLLLGFTLQSTLAQQKWQELRTVEDVCAYMPETMQTLLDRLNLKRPGLDKVRQAHEKKDLVQACTYLLEYYKNTANAAAFKLPSPAATARTVAEADTIMNYVFTIQNVRGEVPLLPDGHRDWHYKGPNNDREWAWLSNRHPHVSAMLNAYAETGNPKYIRFIDEFLRDFIIKSMPYPGVRSSTSVWRGLEVAARINNWVRVFYGLMDSPHLTPATRLLILSSMPDHAHYNRNFHHGGNWLTMEISALANATTGFPEFEDADEWLDYAVTTMTESMKEQVYPDGVQNELTAHYHRVALYSFERFKEICDRSNRPLPAFFNETIVSMYDYLARTVRPDGMRILNNDGDRGSDREALLAAAEKYRKPEWTYLATNGKRGEKPALGPSYVYPWAGHLISRSGYDADAHWSFFDVGPWGSGHQHNDKLHLSVSAYGRDLLVDAGRFAYTGEVAAKFRPYALGSAGHNLVLIDGNGQAPGPRLAEEPLGESYGKTTSAFDYATGEFSNFKEVEGRASHTRALLYVRGEFWVVVDRIQTDRPRKIETLWHWHPDCAVEKQGTSIRTDNAAGNLAVVPVGSRTMDIRFVKGQEEPEVQGWYSPEYNLFGPNVATLYRADIDRDQTFVWLLLPARGKVPPVKARILSETEEAVRVEVVYRGKTRRLTIPYRNSQKVLLENEPTGKP